MALTMQFGAPLSADGILYVHGSGNDSNDGLTRITSMRSIATAYAALPSTGGVIHVGPGRYDVGSGLALTRAKPVWLIGSNPVPRLIGSTLTAPLSLNCAILYTSTGAASLVTTIAGTAANRMDGLRFENLVFEFSNAATLIGIDAVSCCFGEVTCCYFWADKTSGSPGPAAVTAQGIFARADAAYDGAGGDASWWRVWHNHATNLALCTFGGNNLNCNQNVIRENVCLGLNHSNATAKPAITIDFGHRCAVRDNNIEAYNRAILFDSCRGCHESGDGGEFVDIFLDLPDTKGCYLAPSGMHYSTEGLASGANPLVAGAMLVRGDTFTHANIINLPAVWKATGTAGLYPPTDDGTGPAVTALPTDNIVISSEYTSNSWSAGAVSTTTPGAVATVNIAHGLATTPVKFTAQPGNAAARTALLAVAASGLGLGMYVSADATNVILNFSGNLTAATSYAWAWTAEAR